METPNIIQSQDSSTYRYTFRDFVTPSPEHFIHATGERAALDALDFTLSRGSCIHRLANLEDLDIYTPLLTSINHACKIHRLQGYFPITRDDLVNVQYQPWFNILLNQYAKTYHLSDYAQLIDETQLTGDRVVIILEALAIAQRIPKMQLGVVDLREGSLPHACFYPPSQTNSNITVWLAVETRFKHSEFHGIGSSAVLQQHQQGQDSEDEETSSDEAEEQPLEPVPMPRDTAARVLAQQVPLPTGLTAANILTHHKDRLQYNNILKVALIYSNQKIADECKAGQKLQQASGVVKRINTALTWIEREFKISAGAFRAAFDAERKNNGIVVRGKDDVVDDAVLAANASKIHAAMTWIKAGGPRPRTT
jgi:hypothetical protein